MTIRSGTSLGPYEILASIGAGEMGELTGYGLPEDKERAVKAGFDEHLTKPIEVEKLRDLLLSIQQPQS